MAGVTNTVFRRICRTRGADIVTSEFVSAEGIFRRNPRTQEYLDFHPDERPFGVQLFGADPEHLADAAKQVVDWLQPDFIDLNVGCPVNKVVCKHGGSALLKETLLLESIAQHVVKAVAPLPVTAKIRIGWNVINAPQIAQLLESTGIQRLAVHGRTKEQGYSGQADWNVITEVVQSVKIPVIGNGDITSAAQALHLQRKSQVAGLMIGRAAMSNPWIFSEIKAAFDPSFVFHSPTLQERWALIHEHCQKEVERGVDEVRSIKSLRARLMAYSKGMAQGRSLREAFAQLQSLAELDDLMTKHLQSAAAIGIF